MKTIRRMPSLRSLHAFQVAGRHLSFKLAAEELCITPSAVSHQVKNLETSLGLDLFARKTRALEFTDAGKKYFDFLDGMFARLEMETHQLWAEYGRQMVRLCVPPFFASELLLPKMDALQAIIPDTDIRISTQPSLMNSHPAEADLSILLGSGEWPELVTHPLFARRLVVAAAPALLKDFDNSSFSSLDGQTLIMHENRPNLWSNWARALDIPVPKAGQILRFDSKTAVVQAAAQGLGFAIVSLPLTENWLRSNALKRVYQTEWVTDEYFYVAHRDGEQNRPEIARLIQWFIEMFRTNG